MKRLRPSVHLAVVTALLMWTLPQHSYADTQSIVALTKPTVFSDRKGLQNSPADLSAQTPTEIPNFTYNSKESDLWERVRAGYAIPDLDNKLVNNQVTWYSTRTDYILRTVQRGSRYLYHVVEELEKRGMPTELALLPFIESAFNPQAISTTKATGMWQFMAATGTDFNLK